MSDVARLPERLASDLAVALALIGIEERTGLLVDDRSRRSTLAAAMGIRSLALAAVVAQGDVLGVLAVDRARSQRALERVDRDTLAAFASGVGYAIERAALLERLHA